MLSRQLSYSCTKKAHLRRSAVSLQQTIGQHNMKSDKVIEKIRNKLQESDPDNRTVVNIFQFNFTDADGELIKSVELNIYEGRAAIAPDAEITVSDEDFYLVGTKETTFDALLANNKAHVQGDAEAINKMMEKFRLNAKE